MEEDGEESGTTFCIASSLTGLSSQFAHVHWSGVEWEAKLSSKCYPPLTGCVFGNETACDAASGREHVDLVDECQASMEAL